MADLELYEVPIRSHVTVMQLTAEDAQALRDRDGLDVKKVQPATPARKPAPPAPVEPKAESPRTKGRQPRNKAAE